STGTARSYNGQIQPVVATSQTKEVLMATKDGSRSAHRGVNCPRQVGYLCGSVRTCVGSGKRWRRACPARTPRFKPASLVPLGTGGFGVQASCLLHILLKRENCEVNRKKLYCSHCERASIQARLQRYKCSVSSC